MSDIANRRLPAEWESQSGVMLTWPHQSSDWAPYLETVEQVYANIAREIASREALLIVAFDENHRTHIQACLEAAGVAMQSVRFACIPSNDTWARDHGPITIYKNKQPVLLDFIFNGWGQKFDAALDTKINQQLHAQHTFGALNMVSFPYVLEGGSLDTDGQGSLLTTAYCLLSPLRNPAFDRQAWENLFSEQMGIDRVLWLEHGMLEGDDTDSHIDMLARFCDAKTIAYTSCTDETDPHFAPLQAMADELCGFTTREGQPYRLVALPIPPAIYDESGQRLPASYANFLIINQAVLVPLYGDITADSLALERLHECFPTHQVIGINCLPLIHQYGSLHCISMQLPEGVLI